MTDESRLATAAALRALNNAFVAHDADAGLLDRIAESAREAVEALRTAERRDMGPIRAAEVGRMFRSDRSDEEHGGAANPLQDRAVGGPWNPISADLDFEYLDDQVVIRTVLGASYGGAPGRAHGGMVAALFDDVTGFVLPLAGTPAYTGRLTVRYHRPVPVGVQLEFRARVQGREGRKLHVVAECQSEGEIVATADALFIAVDVDRFGTLD